MHPQVHILGISISSYFLMFLLSYAVSLIAIALRIRSVNLDRKTSWLFVVCAVAGGMIGMRLLYIVYHLDVYIANPALLRYVIVSGFAFYGALYGGLAGGYLYSRRAGKSFLYLSDNLLFMLPLGHAIRKIGCFLGGCCYGTETSCAIGKVFNEAAPDALMNRHPVQLYEAAVNLIIFAVLIGFLKKKPRTGTVLAVYLVLYGVGRFVTDFYRGETSGEMMDVIWRISISQIISIVTVIFGVIILFRTAQKKEGV